MVAKLIKEYKKMATLLWQVHIRNANSCNINHGGAPRLQKLSSNEPGHHLDRFGLVSLFNGISTSVGYLMPKPFS